MSKHQDNREITMSSRTVLPDQASAPRGPATVFAWILVKRPFWPLSGLFGPVIKANPGTSGTSGTSDMSGTAGMANLAHLTCLAKVTFLAKIA